MIHYNCFSISDRIISNFNVQLEDKFQLSIIVNFFLNKITIAVDEAVSWEYWPSKTIGLRQSVTCLLSRLAREA